jgi:nitrite reductase (NADH) small subunit
MTWTTVCRLDQIVPATGVAALLGQRQIAVIRLGGNAADQVFAVGNFDPVGKAMVMSRGIVGDHAGKPTLTSPLLKQVYDLASGACLDKPEVRLPTYPTRVVDGRVQIAVT